ncbi:hypothetical protein N9X71_05505, partial [Paracoccus sp. (in: a-proteobacteria)]|nr:hypothetical protein [Paracoccus sp. (in: a-proteobacteria)]
ILAAAAKLAGWIKDRFNKAVDTGVAIGVAYGLANPETIKAALISTAQAIQVWLNSLNWPF